MAQTEADINGPKSSDQWLEVQFLDRSHSFDCGQTKYSLYEDLGVILEVFEEAT